MKLIAGTLLSGMLVASASAGEIVTAVLAARDAGKPMRPLTQEFEKFDLDRAYQLQAKLDDGLAKRLGPRAGYKVAYASKSAQQQFGVSEPARGTFFALQRVQSGSRVQAERFRETLLECEVAFTIGKRIDAAVAGVKALKPMVASVHAAIDAGNFIFDAGDGPGPVAADLVASGTGANVFVLGPAVDPAGIDLAGLPMTVSRNGEVIRESNADEVLGSPWNSLLWLVNHVVKQGRVLEPGEVVLTGTAAKAYREMGEKIPGEYVCEVGGLGKVMLRIR